MNILLEKEVKYLSHISVFIAGDAAVGVGVARHTLSSTISKLKHGFKLNLGLYFSLTFGI